MRTLKLLIAMFVFLFSNISYANVRIEEHIDEWLFHEGGYVILRDPLSFLQGSYDEKIFILMPTDGYISSDFGPRRDPITRHLRIHSGIDVAAAFGTAVRAGADGIVIQAGAAGGCGNAVIIDHGGGLTTRYCHLGAVDVGRSVQVDMGERIGWVGSSGRSTGSHLHFEMRVDGVAVDPMGFIGY